MYPGVVWGDSQLSRHYLTGYLIWAHHVKGLKLFINNRPRPQLYNDGKKGNDGGDII